MFKLGVAAAAVIFAGGAVPASAVILRTFDLGVSPVFETTGSIVVQSNPIRSKTLTLTGLTYTVAPTALVNISQLTAGGILRQSAGGIGMRSGAENNTEWDQIDTNPSGSGANAKINEILHIDLTGMRSKLVSAKFNWVDADDTLRIYGRNGTTMTYLGFPGEFWDNTVGDAPISGGAIVTGHTGPGRNLSNNWTFSVDFASTLGIYDSFYFTSNNNSSDGYRLQEVTLSSMPDAASWAMMVAGFGLMGAMLRRRREVPLFG